MGGSNSDDDQFDLHNSKKEKDAKKKNLEIDIDENADYDS